MTVIIANVNGQNSSNNTGNPSSTNEVANTNTGNPEAAVQTDNQPERPRRRRLRPVKRRRQRKGPGGGKVTAPEPAKSVSEAAQKVVEIKKPAAKSPSPAQDSGFGQDPFFDLFAETTTVAATPEVPPPEFSINIPPKKKVMPTVDTKNSKAYDGTPCNETFKNHDTDPTKYMMKYADGVWETLDCPPNLGTGLVWRQDLCACGEELVPQDPDDMCAMEGYNAHPTNKHKYVRNHHGTNAVMECAASLVWSQQQCLCIFDPAVKDRPIENPGDAARTKCKVILRLEFEGNLKNDAEAYHIGTVARKGKLPRIIFRKVPGSTGKVAMIYSQPMEFLAFSGNDFQTQVTYSLRFKISPRHQDKDHFMVLITDQCIIHPGGQNRTREPSIRLAFRPNTQTFHLHFKTDNVDLDRPIDGAQPDKDGWYKVILYFEDQTVNLVVNGNTLLSQPDITGKIPQNRCPLYIAGRGPGFDRSEDFYGYLDNVFLVKDCTFKTSDVKFLR